MANKLIQDLGAGAFALTDLLEHQPIAGPPSLKGDVAALVTLLNTIYAPITGGAYVLKAGDTMTGLLTIAQATANTSNLILSGYSLTGANAQSLLSMAGTVNTTGAPTVMFMNITKTAVGNAWMLLDLQVDGSSLFSVAGFNGTARTNGGQIQVYDGSMIQKVALSPAGITMLNIASVIWSSTSSSQDPADLYLTRDSAGTLAQRNTTNAQAFRWYRTFTDSTNYERGALQTAAGQVILAAETAGTGTDDIDVVLTPAGVGRVTLPGGAQLLKTTAAMTSGAAAALGTLTNAPSAGNAAVWCPIMFNGVQHWFPCWT